MIERPRIVLDTNVLISGMLTKGSAPALAVDKAVKEYRVLACSQTIAELWEIAGRGKFNRYLPVHARQEYVEGLVSRLEVINAAATVRVCRDWKDDKFLALARAGQANLIVSGDDDLLSLMEWEGIKIISPAEFLRLAQTSSPR